MFLRSIFHWIITVKYPYQHGISCKLIRRWIGTDQNWNESSERISLCVGWLKYAQDTWSRCQRKSLTTTSAVRRPETMAPWTEGVSRWSPPINQSPILSDVVVVSVQEDVLVVVRAEFDTYVNVANTEHLTQIIQTDVPWLTPQALYYPDQDFPVQSLILTRNSQQNRLGKQHLVHTDYW